MSTVNDLAGDAPSPETDGGSNWFPQDEDDLFRWGQLYARRLKDRMEKWLVPMVDADAEALKLARIYFVVRALSKEFEEALKVLESQKDGLPDKLHDAYERDKAGKTLSVKFDDTEYRVTISVTPRSSIRKDQKDAAFQWLRDHKLGDLIVETVNAGTLSAAAAQLVKEGRELPEEAFTSYYQNTASVTKVK